MKQRKYFSLLYLILFTSLILVACTKNTDQTSNQSVQIVTSTNVYADIAKQVLGKYGKASAVINNPDADPHDFEPTTASAKLVSQADLVIANGLGYDSWMDNLASANHKDSLKVGENAMGLKKGDNPHIWYNLDMPSKFVKLLVKHLAKIDAKHTKQYQANAKRYLQKIAQIRAVAAKTNGYEDKQVFVSEPVFDYALQATGYKIGNQAFEQAIEDETDPSAKVIAQMNQAIKRKDLAFFVYNTQASSATVKALLNKVKAQKIPVLGVRETMPAGVSYYSWMKKNYEQLYKLSR